MAASGAPTLIAMRSVLGIERKCTDRNCIFAFREWQFCGRVLHQDIELEVWLGLRQKAL